MSEERLQTLELKIAYLERANQELSDVLYAQQRELVTFKAQVTALAEQLAAFRNDFKERADMDERPPHY